MENADRARAEAPSSLRDGQQEAERNFRGRADLHLTQRTRNYLDALLHSTALERNQVTSVILCGSAVNGAFSEETSDVDLIIVLRDMASAEHRRCLHEAVLRLEIEHGFRSPSTRTKNPVERFAEHAGGHAASDFICTRSDLLSGDVARVFHLRTAEKPFVPRIVLASVILSAVTIWGEDLLPGVPLLPLRRLDVFKACFNLFSMLLLSAAGYPVLSDATKYALSALKHALHSWYFCYHLRTASLDEEVAFFNSRLSKSVMLQELLKRRRTSSRSFGVVLRCMPVVLHLHLRTLRDNHFPRAVSRASQCSQPIFRAEGRIQ